MHTRARDIAEWLKDRVSAAGSRGIVVGLSGGIDSAVVVGLSAMAMPGRVVGVMLPCHSDPQDRIDAQIAADHFKVPAITIDLAPAYDTLLSDLRKAVSTLPREQQPVAIADEVDIRMRVPVANVKPRLRMTSLYFIANSLNYLVAGTGNRSEITLGYYTKYGDGGCDVLPIGALLKSEVRSLAKELSVPKAIIEKAPSAGLWIGQTDEAEMGFTYDTLEKYLTEGPSAVPKETADRIEQLRNASNHKRALPPIPPAELLS